MPFVGKTQNLYLQGYSSIQGLSQNSVCSSAETKDGFMWFGTMDGLNRFDGMNFIKVNLPPTIDSATGFDFNNLSGMTTTLYADKADHLWVGTNKELVLYDRYKNTYTLPANAYKGFYVPENSWILKIIEDNDNNIWILTQKKGLFCYKKTLQKMQQLNWAGKQPSTIVAIELDKQDHIWACGNKEMYNFDQHGTFLPNGIQRKLPSPTSEIKAMALINGQAWFILNDYRLVTLQKQVLLPFQKTFSGNHFLADARIIHQSDSNTVWVGSCSGGIIKIDLDKKTFENADPTSNTNHPIRQYVISFFTNSQHITWVGFSGDGLAKYDEQKMQIDLWRNTPKTHGQVPDNMILSVFSENDEDFYMGTETMGLLHTNVKTNTHQYYIPSQTKIKAAESNSIYGIIGGEKNLIWMATANGLCSYNKRTNEMLQYANDNDKYTKNLCAILKIKNQNKIMVGGFNGGIRFFNLDNKKWEPVKDPANLLDTMQLRVRYMQETDNGNIYMATETNNIINYNYISGKLTFYKSLDSISGCSKHFCMDGKYLWDATVNGLIQVEKYTMRVVKVWNTSNGLPNNIIYAVLPDGYGRVWATSNAGLTMLDPISGSCKSFTDADGLQAMEFNTASCYKDKKGILWFGGINGLNRINPTVVSTNSFSPQPFITKISVMNVPYQSDTATPYLHQITLPFSKNFISLEFQSPQYSQSGDIEYEYRLNGVDTGWVKSGTRNFANYTQLKPGRYTFWVRSANPNGIWCKQVSALSIIIVPPWYNTLWFNILSSFIIITSIVSIVRWRINNARRTEMQKTEIQKLSAEQYKSQLELAQITNYFSSSLLDKTNLDDVLGDVSKNLIGKLGFEDCMVYLWNVKKTKMVQKAGYGPKSLIEKIGKQPFDVEEGQGVVGYVMQTMEAVMIADTSKDTRYRQNGMRRSSELCVPIKYNNELIGIMDSEHHQKDFFTQRHLQLLNTIAALVANKIQSIESEQRVVQKILEMDAISLQLKSAQLDALRSQMDPHFIFNSLNSIENFILKNERILASEYLGKFSKLIRNILDNSKRETVPIGQEIETLKIYIELERLRMNNVFDVNYEIEDGLQESDIEIPPMLMQPYVENAILHGIRYLHGGGQLLVNMFIANNGNVHYIVQDNGIGRAKAAVEKANKKNGHQSYGILITQSRIDIYNQLKNTNVTVTTTDLYHVNNETSAGTMVEMVIPV